MDVDAHDLDSPKRGEVSAQTDKADHAFPPECPADIRREGVAGDWVSEQNRRAGAVSPRNGSPNESKATPRARLRRQGSRIERLPSLALRRHQGHAKTFILSGWQSRLAGSVVNLCSTILGTGILALPLTGVRLGLIPMVVMLLTLGVANAYSCRLLLLVGAYTNSYAFEEVTERTMGVRTARFLDVCILVRSLIVLSSILIFTGDFLFSLVDALGLGLTVDQSLLTVLVTVLVIYPLALMRSMNSLAGFSFFKMVCLGAYVAVVVYLAARNMWVGKQQPFRLVDLLSWRWLGPLPIAAFSYHSQVNLFPIYAEIKRPTLRKGTHMITLAYAICSGLFVLVSAFGYLHFPSSRTGNYLSNFGDAGGDVIHVLRASFLVVTVFTFPMQLFAARIAVHSLVWAHQEKMSATQSFVITTLMTAVALAVSLSTDDIALVLGIGGSIFTSYVSMILPAQIYLRVLDMRGQGDGGLLNPQDRWSNEVSDLEWLLDDEGSVQVASAFEMATHPAQIKYEKVKAWALLVTGLVIGVVGLVATLVFK